MRSIETLGDSVTQFTSNVISDTASNQSLSTTSFNALATRISPPPRKLNRRVKGVWYEYDNVGSPDGTPRKRIDSVSVDTPPKSPVIFKHV
jgi:hypothetical protein